MEKPIEKSGILTKPTAASEEDGRFMRLALELAKEAGDAGETPIGAVVVWDDGRIVGRGRNRREGDKNALAHAEIEAIGEACRTLGGWRLHKATLYVTLEPCPMCAGAIVNARVKRVVYGASDRRFGAMGSLFDLTAYPLNHRPEICRGVLEAECSALLSEFFAGLRKDRQPVSGISPIVP